MLKWQPFAGFVRLRENLNRVNAQLGEFYGSSVSISEASEAAWQHFRNQVRPGNKYLFSTSQRRSSRPC